MLYDLLKILATIFFPPLGVAMHSGLNVDFLINLVLTLLMYFPGLIHGFYILTSDN